MIGRIRIFSMDSKVINFIISLLCIITFAALGYIAISDQNITIGGRYGISHSEGTHAVVVGFFLIGVAFIFAAESLERIFNKTILFFLFLILWLCGIYAYWLLK